MAEFCLECLNKMFETNYKKRHVVLDDDLCEGCGEWKQCVVIIKREPFFSHRRKKKSINLEKEIDKANGRK